MKRVFTIFSIMTALCFAGGLHSTAFSGMRISVRGAYSMWGRVHSLATVYMKEHPQVEVSVYSHSLVDQGMEALIEGRADVAMASRKITPRESEQAKTKGIKLDEHLIGYGAIVIITDRRNPVNVLTVAQVKQIMTGRIVKWKQVGGKDLAIEVFQCSAKLHPGTIYFIKNGMLDGASITGRAVTLANFPDVVKKVGDTAGAVACVRIRDQFPGPQARTKILKVREDANSPPVSPSRDTISDGTYPFRQPYYFYTAATADKEVRDFVEFAVSRGWGQPVLTHVW